MSKPYDVGYGKPPVESQFRKGKSGNPFGRPKRPKAPLRKVPNVTQALVDALSSSVTITENGEKKELTSLEALLKSAVMRAIQGNKPMAKFIMDEAKKLTIDDFAGERLFTYREGGQTHYLTQSNLDAMDELAVALDKIESALAANSDDGIDDAASLQEGDAVENDKSFNLGNGDLNSEVNATSENKEPGNTPDSHTQSERKNC